MKEALQTITAEEHAKLERYQQLRRNGREKPPANELMLWELRCAMKSITAWRRLSDGLKHSLPKYSPTPEALFSA